MNSFPKIEVLASCAKYGPVLKVPSGLDGERVMIAMAANESGGGDVKFVGNDCGPRHEPAYDVGGSVWASSPAQRSLVAQYSRNGASSFGPWQTMLINCPGFTPAELETNLDDCARSFVSHFNSYVAHFEPKNLTEIGQIWNLGHKTVNPPVGVIKYCEDLQKAYNSTVKKTAYGVS